MQRNKTVKNEVKKGIIKNLMGKKPNADGKSPIKMEGGLGKKPLGVNLIADGGGSNLGTNGVF